MADSPRVHVWPVGVARTVSLKDLAARTPLCQVRWREGTKGKLAGRFARLRVWPGLGHGRLRLGRADQVALIEERADGKIPFAFSNLPATTRRIEAVRLWKSRWPMEQGDQQI